MSEVYEIMKKYGSMMASQPYTVGAAAKMILQTSQGVFATRDGADMGKLKEGEAIRFPFHQQIFSFWAVRSILSMIRNILFDTALLLNPTSSPMSI